MKFKLINIYAASTPAGNNYEEAIRMQVPPAIIASVTGAALLNHGLEEVAHRPEKMITKENGDYQLTYKLYVYQIEEERDCGACKETSTAEETESAEGQGLH